MAVLKKDRVYQLLKTRILTGEYPPESKLPRELELAKQEKVAFLTLRSALARLEEEGLIARIPGKGTFVREADAVPAGTPRILLLLPGFCGIAARERLFNRQLIAGCVQEAYLHGMQLEIADFQTPAAEIVERFRVRELGGVIWDRIDGEDLPRLELLREAGVPVVTVNRCIDGIPAVSCDYAASLQSAVRFLTGIGHRELLLIDQEPRLPLFGARQEAFRSMIAATGCAPDCLLTPPAGANGMFYETFFANTPLPGAVICSYSFIDGFYDWICDRQLRIPRDLSVILWGETERFHAAGSHPFAILTEPRSGSGSRAVALLVQLMERNETPPDEALPGELLVLKGCSIPPKKIIIT